MSAKNSAWKINVNQYQHCWKTACKPYFDCSLGEDHLRMGSRHTVYIKCYVNLTQWLQGKNDQGVSMIWWEPTQDYGDCYFCLTNVTDFASKNKITILYSNVSSAIRPLIHGQHFRIPITPAAWQEIPTLMTIFLTLLQKHQLPEIKDTSQKKQILNIKLSNEQNSVI